MSKNIIKNSIEHEKRRRYKKGKRRKRFLKRLFRIGIVLGAFCFAVYLGAIVLMGVWKYFISDIDVMSDIEELTVDWSFGKKEKVDVVLDAGHGGKDGGAVNGDILEKDINFEIAKLVKQQLEAADLCVKMVREDDSFFSLKERAKYANKYNAKVFVSIHCNSTEGEASGIETYYDRFDAKSQLLAAYIQQCLILETRANDRSVKAADYTVIRDTKMPAALAEVGFLSDEEECKLLQDLEYQKKLAKGIADGVEAFLEE